MSATPSGPAPDVGMESRASWKFWLGLLVVLGATGFIVTTSMGSTVHYYDVDVVVSDRAFVGEPMRLRGLVVDNSHRVRAGTLDEHLFVLTANQERVTVLYKGALPDQFQDGASVIATGVLRDDGETFDAEAITAQCPSRYENSAPTARANHEALGGGRPTIGSGDDDGDAVEPAGSEASPEPLYGPYFGRGLEGGGYE